MRSEMGIAPLPDHFVDSLRILFDILDTNRTGHISYQQLCSRWGELPTPQIPPSFLHCLGMITPRNGMLTFERFLAAVRQSLNEQNIYGIRSESRIPEMSVDKKRNGPTMGLNGLDRRTVYGSHSSAGTAGENHENGDVRMRVKKNTAMFAQNERTKQPESKRATTIRFRPQSTVSFASIASSGMSDVRRRNSHVSSSASTASSNRTLHDSPRYNKHEMLLEEEKEIVNRGIDNAQKLLAWYNERLASLEKRTRLLNKGMVTLDTAVHEQRLNYLRAHISELNRRITSLMESSEHGFPTHCNLQIKTQMPQPNDDRAHYLQRQNRMLCQELVDKDRIIDELRRERTRATDAQHTIRRIQPQRNPAIGHRPSALVRPALHQTIETCSTGDTPVKVHNTLM
uniref:EF-hand domain-containing protein n=2 Tax=Parascaris univalens TaxID=6257 RepID=A0A915A7L1_PARUN